MLGWLLYTTSVGSALGVAGLLAEHGLRRLGRSVRWVWAGAMAATVALPAVAFVGGGVRSAGPADAAAAVIWSRVAAVAGSPTLDGVLLAAWIVLSLVLLANLRLSARTLRRNEALWRTARVGGHRVLVSAGFGPGVVGVARPRIVVPAWVLGADPSLQRLVARHEDEHARAGDLRLLLAGVVVVMLVPWCLPLWWQLRRLRTAMEADCDARVLAATSRPREYASALMTVAGRPTRRPLPVPALAPAPRELERRIRLITSRPGRASKRAGWGLLLAAGLVALALAVVPVPEPPGFGNEAAGPETRVPRTIMIFTVAGEVQPG